MKSDTFPPYSKKPYYYSFENKFHKFVLELKNESNYDSKQKLEIIYDKAKSIHIKEIQIKCPRKKNHSTS